MTNESYENIVKVPVDYFYKMSMMDYSSPHTAVIREFFQNSVDAGCKNFILCFDESNHEIVIIDDGCGMNEDIIRNRLLVMGGSHKEHENTAIGAFGHAKVLIYFSWIKYEIFTKDLHVVGKANLYRIEHSTDEFIRGTVSKISLPEKDFSIIRNCANDYFQLCETNVNIYMIKIDSNGEYVETKLLNQILKKEQMISGNSNFMDIFIGNTSDDFAYLNKYVYVRSNGTFMFSRYVNNIKVPIIIETKGSARDFFTQNRDSFKREYGTDFSEFLSKISNDNVTSVSPEFQKFILKEERKPSRGRCKDNERNLYNEGDGIVIRGKTHKESARFFKKTRSLRMKMFLDKIVNKFIKSNKYTEKLDIGFVFNGSIEGMITIVEDRYVLFVNPDVIEAYVDNHRKMCWKMMDIIMHELAHYVSIVKEDNRLHNESFVIILNEIREFFWDDSENYAMFKECWKSFSGK